MKATNELVLSETIQIKCTLKEKKAFRIEAEKSKFRKMSLYGRQLLKLDQLNIKK